MDSILYILIAIVFVSLILSVVMAIVGLNKSLNQDILNKTQEPIKLPAHFERDSNIETALQELRSQITELKSDVISIKDKSQLSELIKKLLEDQRRISSVKSTKPYIDWTIKHYFNLVLSKEILNLNLRSKRIADLNEAKYLKYKIDPDSIKNMNPLSKEQLKKIFSNEIINN